MKSCCSLIVVFFGLMSFTSSLSAQNAVGYDFLRSFVGGRPSGMGGAFVAVPGDIHSLRYNPAGLSTLRERQGTTSYLNHLLDFQSGFLAYAHPAKLGTFAVGLHYFDYGQFEGKDENNVDTGEFGSNSFSLSLGYGRKVVRNLHLGASAKIVRFQIDDFNATAVAVDVGFVIGFPDYKLNVGGGVFNVGKTTSAFFETKDDLPLNFQVGIAKELEHLPVMISATVLKFKEDDLNFRVGGEFSFTEQLLFRAGYNSVGQDQKVGTSRDRIAGLSLGVGFKIRQFDLDYAISSFGELGTLNRLSLVGRF